MPGENLKSQGVTPNTLVWKQGMSAWTMAGQVPELSQFFARPTSSGATPPQGGYQQGGPQGGYQQSSYAYQPQGVQQSQGVQQPQGMPPSNNLVWAILVTIFCCLPFGIVSIVYASKVDGLWAAGRTAEAYQASKNAQTWAIVSAVISIVIWAVYFIAIANSVRYW